MKSPLERTEGVLVDPEMTIASDCVPEEVIEVALVEEPPLSMTPWM
jgi:hypothetical protein